MGGRVQCRVARFKRGEADSEAFFDEELSGRVGERLNLRFLPLGFLGGEGSGGLLLRKDAKVRGLLKLGISESKLVLNS